MKLLMLLLLCGCAPLDEQERLGSVEKEVLRREYYHIWKTSCAKAGRVVFVYKASRPCRGKNCVPHRMDWSFRELSDKEMTRWMPGDPMWRPRGSNSYKCLSQQQVRSMMRNL